MLGIAIAEYMAQDLTDLAATTKAAGVLSQRMVAPREGRTPSGEGDRLPLFHARAC